MGLRIEVPIDTKLRRGIRGSIIRLKETLGNLSGSSVFPLFGQCFPRPNSEGVVLAYQSGTGSTAPLRVTGAVSLPAITSGTSRSTRASRGTCPNQQVSRCSNKRSVCPLDSSIRTSSLVRNSSHKGTDWRNWDQSLWKSVGQMDI